MATKNKEATKNTASRIAAKRKELSADFAKYNKSLRPLKKAIKAYESYEAAYNEKESAKNERRLNEAGIAVDGHLIRSSRIFTELMKVYREILSEYDYLADVSKGKRAKKADKDRAEFIKKFNFLVDKANAGLGDFLPRESTAPVRVSAPASASSVNTSATASDNAAPVHTVNSPVTVSSVNVAPVNIDITPMVEKAISATVDKFSRDLDKRLEAYLNGIKLPVPNTVSADTSASASTDKGADLSAVHTYSSANTELEAHILEEEQHVFEKLKGLCESVQSLVEGLAEVSSSVMTASLKQKEIAELQKQINDTQRFTMREQQGIQVSQKLISEEQADLAGKQAVVSDTHKLALEAHAAVEEGLKNIAETQSAVVQSQNALETAMLEVVNSQKELLSAQQEIIKATEKQRETQAAICEKQGEIARAQKEFLAEERQILKDQKALKERQRTVSDGVKELAGQHKKRTRTAETDKAPSETAETNLEKTEE